MRRSAKEVVNWAGICWTTNVPGAFAGRAESTRVNAAGGNLQLLPGSPCINAGFNAPDTDVFTPDVQPLPEYDRNGNGCIYNGVVDMGAYEFRDSDGDGIPDVYDTPSVHNLTQGMDHFTLLAAINSAKSGDEIAADQGRYSESINFGGKAIILRSSDPNDPNVVAKTIIDATGLGTFSALQLIVLKSCQNDLHKLCKFGSIMISSRRSMFEVVYPGNSGIINATLSSEYKRPYKQSFCVCNWEI